MIVDADKVKELKNLANTTRNIMSDTQKSDTPRTDREEQFESGVGGYVSAHFAGQLEREVAALTTERDELQKRIGYTDVQEQFQRETLRTSELSQLLIKFIEHHQVEHTPGPWSRSCSLCALVGEARALLMKPINRPAEAELDTAHASTGETMTKKPDLIERLREDLAKKVELFSWEEGASGDKKYAYGFAAMVIRGCNLSQYETEATELRAELDAAKRALKELVRLKTLRDDLGAKEKAGTIEPRDLRKQLLRYGREKDVAWAVARGALAAKSAEHGGL